MGDMDVPAIFPILAMLIFLALFIVIVWHTYSLKKTFVDQMADMPLIDELTSNENTSKDE